MRICELTAQEARALEMESIRPDFWREEAIQRTGNIGSKDTTKEAIAA